MQLKALRAALAVLVSAGWALAADVAPAHADPPKPEAGASISFYADDDSVTVISPAASTTVPLTDTVAVDAAATLDVVSAASIDVVSQATPYAMSERRVEGAVGVTAAPFASVPELELSLRGIGSTENDYDALTLAAGARYEAFERNTTFLLSYGLGLDDVGRRNDPTFSRSRNTHHVTGTVTQVLDARTVADLVVDTSYVDGYQASPYRFVPIYDASGQRAYSLPERTPDGRWMGSALVRLRHAFGDSSEVYVHADYRFYLDDWGVLSHTVSVRGVLPLADERLSLSAAVRGYFQRGADFYERRYRDDGRGAPALRTRDRILGGMQTLSAEVSVLGALGGLPRDPDLRLFASASLLRFTWLDYELQAGRWAMILTLGASAPF